MPETVRGNPTRLEAYTERTLPAIDRARSAIEEYSQAVGSYNDAGPNDLRSSLPDLGGELHATLDALSDLDGTPADFASALRALDTGVGLGGAVVVERVAFEEQLAQQTRDGGLNALPDWLAPFFLGDIANFWTGGEDGFPVGSLSAAEIRSYRTYRWLRVVAETSRHSPEAARVFPTFNTGLVGRRLATGLSRVPWAPVSRAGAWLPTSAATAVFTKVNVVGGVVSTGMGVYDIVQQGDPIDAYHREGAGYVADWASTAFSATSTAFFIAPNPVTGALVIASGVVWAGAEVVDHWDDITAWVDDSWEAAQDFSSDLWEGASNVFEGVRL